VLRIALVLPAVLLLLIVAFPAQSQAPKSSPYAAVPPDEAGKANPVKSTPESLARGKKWYNFDCSMCHGDTGDGKGDVAQDTKLQLVNFTDPATLRDRRDGEIAWVIRNGHQDMPPEGPRVMGEEIWDLVNYVRSLSKPKSDTAQKP